MSRELIVFLSSTVDDLGDVRHVIAETLRSRGIVVRQSEKDGFPIEPGVTSHQACIEAVKGAHVLITLVALRYGGIVKDGSGKSITWSEYDAARAENVYPVALVRKDMNKISIEIAKRRAAIATTPMTPEQTDELLSKEFPDLKPYVHNLPAQQRFIDEIRKAKVDNWSHLDWNGTPADALAKIESRLATLLAAGLDGLSRASSTVSALRRFMGSALVLVGDAIDGRRTRDSAVERLLQLVAEKRVELLGFREKDRHNLMVYQRVDDKMKPGPRAAHDEIAVKNRTWKIGEGHVGKAALQTAPLVTANLPATDVWVPTNDAKQDQRDRKNYVSAVSVPLPVDSAGGKADAVLIVTSSREGHFHDDEQAEVLTCVALGRILGLILAAKGKPDA